MSDEAATAVIVAVVLVILVALALVVVPMLAHLAWDVFAHFWHVV